MLCGTCGDQRTTLCSLFLYGFGDQTHLAQHMLLPTEPSHRCQRVILLETEKTNLRPYTDKGNMVVLTS